MIQNYIDVNIKFTEHYGSAGKLESFLLQDIAATKLRVV